MSNNFSLDLASLLIHLEFQSKKVLENKLTKQRLCYCRKAIIKKYSDILQKFLIRLSARTLKFFDDKNYEITTNICDLENWFFSEIYDSLFECEKISNKMIMIFKYIQKDLDKKFLNIIEHKYKKFILLHDRPEEFEIVLLDLFTEIRAWFDLFLYNVLAIQIDCRKIDPSILPFNLENNERCGEGNICLECPMKNECSSCNIKTDCKNYTTENILIIMNNEYIRDTKQIKTFFDVITKYYVSPKETLDIIFDFRMFDESNPLYFNRDLLYLMEESENIFRNIFVKNYNGIIFNIFEEKVKKYLWSK